MRLGRAPSGVLASAVLLTLVLGQSSVRAVPPTFVVSNTADAGVGSLRQAIIDANNRPGVDEIIFFLGGNPPHRIAPLTPLPAITEAVIIDGTSNPDYKGTPVVEILGDKAGRGASGLLFVAPCNNVQYGRVRGLAINDFDEAGILLMGGCTVVDGNDLGVFETPFGIGVLSNRFGVEISRGTQNLIGLEGGPGNVISGNLVAGVRITCYATRNSVLFNHIGTDPTGTAAVGNGNGVWTGGAGVLIDCDSATGNIIGDTGGSNFISGNQGDGVRITNASGNLVLDNFIGVDVFSGPLPNTGHGVLIDRASINSIGFAGRANDLNHHGNRIWYNGGDGVRVTGPDAATRNEIVENSIMTNGGLGIDLGGDGVTLNDAFDLDQGPNGLENFPALVSATTSLSSQTTTVEWTLNATRAESFRIDFYASRGCDPSGFGEGGEWLGSTTVQTDQLGFAPPNGGLQQTITTTLPIRPGPWITATATDSFNSTSEFSQCVRATTSRADLAVVLTGTSTTIPGGAGSQMNYQIDVANLGPDAADSVMLTDALPSSLTFGSCSATGGGVCGGTGNARTVAFSSLAAGSTATVQITASVVTGFFDTIGGDDLPSDTGGITNSVTVASLTPDPDLRNNTAVLTLLLPGAPDTVPPSITHVSVDKPKLWPPNDQMVEVALAYDASDNVDASTAIQCALGVMSNEGTSADWRVLDAHHVRLRAARLGSRAARVYTIGIGCADRSGNRSGVPVIVTVPHDRR